MSEKTDAKRQLIIDKAAEVFAEKGFRTVTMSDIREACDISRGSLYAYFSSVEEIFRAVLENNESKNGRTPDWDATSAIGLLLWFVKELKKEILKKHGNLAAAIIEYNFSRRDTEEGINPRKSFDNAVKILENILVKGNETGEFECEEPLDCARNMMYVFEGIKLIGAESGVSEKRIDREIVYMFSKFMQVEE